jgi:chromate transporter
MAVRVDHHRGCRRSVFRRHGRQCVCCSCRRSSERSAGEVRLAIRTLHRTRPTQGDTGMSVTLVYLLLLKATVTSFAGMGSLPQIRQDFVDTYHLVSADALSEAVLVGRATPGPMGAYVVAVGYLAAGGQEPSRGGWRSSRQPSRRYRCSRPFQRWLHLPRVRALVDAVVVAGAALLLPAGVGWRWTPSTNAAVAVNGRRPAGVLLCDRCFRRSARRVVACVLVLFTFMGRRGRGTSRTTIPDCATRSATTTPRTTSGSTGRSRCRLRRTAPSATGSRGSAPIRFPAHRRRRGHGEQPCGVRQPAAPASRPRRRTLPRSARAALVVRFVRTAGFDRVVNVPCISGGAMR